MYSLSYTSYMLVRRCPLSHLTSATKYTISKYTTSSTKVNSTISLLEKKEDQENFLKRNYVSVGGKKPHFNIPSMDQIISQSKKLFKEIPFSEMAKAPPTAFWYGISGLAPFVLPSLSFIIFGYSPFLAGAQLAFGATLCSFFGGIKWANSVVEAPQPTVESLGLAIGPQFIAWLSLLMPHFLSYIMVSASLLASTYIDLTTVTQYPQWYRAMRLAFTIPAVICLMLTALLSLFH